MATPAERILLSTAYHAPVQYYSKLIRCQQIYLEQWETYQKQSYRNRCYILSANGILPLSVPVIHTGSKMLIKDVKIDHSKRWKLMHLRAIESAYRSSPFYIYYIDDIKALYDYDFEYLWDMNLSFLKLTLQFLNLEIKIDVTQSFRQIPYPFEDFLQTIHPKTKFQEPDASFQTRTYFQVFGNKFDFVPNLSILDLLFNTGSEAIQWL